MENKYFKNFCMQNFQNKNKNKNCEYQPDELDDNLFENNHEECFYPKKIKFIISKETMLCPKIWSILQCPVPSKLTSPEQFPYQVLLLFYPFRYEKELLSNCPPLYQNKLQEKGSQDVVNMSKLKFESYFDLVDQAFS